MNIQLPDWAEPLLLEDWRYKVMYGGRGGGKSWAVVIALLVLGTQATHRILCAREIQKSMRDSVHRLLKDQIHLMGLSDFYEVLDNEIRGKNGTLFLFTGLQSHTVSSIKSFEGCTVCWCEEAHSISKKSWDVLIPTIRGDGSEIWMTLNPDLDTDETYKRFIAQPSPDTWVKYVGPEENPWFPPELVSEREKAKRMMLKEDYENIWEGKARTTAPGAIYRHEVAELVADGRVRNVPYDPMLPVHTVWDLGWNDAMTIILVQRGPMDVRVIDYIEDSHRTLDWYVARLGERPYRWGTDWLPHDGATRNFQTGKSTQQMLKGMGRNPRVLGMTSIQEGIRAARLMFPRCYFDQTKTARLVECLKRYRRDINSRTDEPNAPVHDEFSHGCLLGDTMVLTDRGEVQIKDVLIGDMVWTPAGYAKVLNSGATKIATKLLEISMNDGGTIIATPEHKFFTRRGLVYADELRYDDSLYSKEIQPCFQPQSRMGYRDAFVRDAQANTQSKRSVAYASTVSQMATTSETAANTCTGMSGISTTGRSPLGTTSTIKTKTRQTTASRIWSFFLRLTTPSTTARQILGLGVKRTESKSCRQENLPNNGTQAKTDGNGTPSTLSNLGRSEHGMPFRASSAGVSSLRPTQQEPSSAIQIAGLRRYVPDVETLVYDLTVERHHCYLANGILVSNSDAFRYLGQAVEKMVTEDKSPINVLTFEPLDTEMGF